jgi:hypothetical protein
LIPDLTGLDAVRTAKQEFERHEYLDPAEAARAYAKEAGARRGGE